MGFIGMRPDVILRFEGGYARSLVISDIQDRYINGLNDPEVNRYLGAVKDSKQTYQSVLDFVESNDKCSSSVLWGIWEGESKQLFGTVRLHGIEFQHRTAHIGVCLFDKIFWGKGLGKKAISTVTKWALIDLNLRWIEASMWEENLVSQKVFISAGYSWKCNISGKFILEGKPAVHAIFAAERNI